MHDMLLILFFVLCYVAAAPRACSRIRERRSWARQSSGWVRSRIRLSARCAQAGPEFGPVLKSSDLSRMGRAPRHPPEVWSLRLR